MWVENQNCREANFFIFFQFFPVKNFIFSVKKCIWIKKLEFAKLKPPFFLIINPKIDEIRQFVNIFITCYKNYFSCKIRNLTKIHDLAQVIYYFEK